MDVWQVANLQSKLKVSHNRQLARSDLDLAHQLKDLTWGRKKVVFPCRPQRVVSLMQMRRINLVLQEAMKTMEAMEAIKTIAKMAKVAMAAAATEIVTTVLPRIRVVVNNGI